MGHPLPVARPRRLADDAAVDVGEVGVEAGVPHAVALGLLPGEVGDVLDGRAEAGGAHHRAVGAGQAPRGHVVPPRAVHVGVEDLLDPVGLEPAPHPGARLLGDPCRGLLVGRRGRGCTDRVEQVGAPVAAHLDEEPVPAVEQLGQAQVERRATAGLGSRPGAHRDAEAGAAGVGARDGDDEGVRAAPGVVRVHGAASGEHRVVDAERAQVAGPHAEERDGPVLLRGRRSRGRPRHRDPAPCAVRATAARPWGRRPAWPTGRPLRTRRTRRRRGHGAGSGRGPARHPGRGAGRRRRRSGR